MELILTEEDFETIGIHYNQRKEDYRFDDPFIIRCWDFKTVYVHKELCW